jgi:hypothetical protein
MRVVIVPFKVKRYIKHSLPYFIEDFIVSKTLNSTIQQRKKQANNVYLS